MKQGRQFLRGDEEERCEFLASSGLYRANRASVEAGQSWNAERAEGGGENRA